LEIPLATPPAVQPGTTPTVRIQEAAKDSNTTVADRSHSTRRCPATTLLPSPPEAGTVKTANNSKVPSGAGAERDTLPVSDTRRREGKSMSRRSGQGGWIEKKGAAYYVRFRIDVLGREKRKNMSVRLCPVSGPGSMTKSERLRKAKEIVQQSGADTEEHFKKCEVMSVANLGVTFRQQSEYWLEHIQTRKRNPIKPKTAANWKSHLNKWILPHLGDMPLGMVTNSTLKMLVAQLTESKTKQGKSLAPKSVNNYVQIVKLVVASAVNDEGEQLYPRKWNHEFIDLPVVDKEKQKRPVHTADEVQCLVAAANKPYGLLYALLAMGLRVNEALGLEVPHVSPDGSTISVRQSVWRGRIQTPKTNNAIRDIDLPSSLAVVLRDYIGNRKSGFVFRTSEGTSLSDSNVRNRELTPLEIKLKTTKAGFHGFRRFRVTHLRKIRVPEDLVQFWIGHASKTVTDGYSKLKEDVTFRKAVAEEVGLGFELPAYWTNGSNVAPSAPMSTLGSTAARSM
jgi:integrase